MKSTSIPYQKQVLSVSSLTQNIKQLIEDTFTFVWISGEISNLKIPASGHAYFTLKDAHAQIAAVIFKGQLKQLSHTLENGNTIIGLGRLSVYEPRGTYQIILEYIEPQGGGALQAAFEKLKQQLADEGLFNEKHKKPIPVLPLKIAVITSPSGSVVKDIIKVIGRRFPNMTIDIYPVRVQGGPAVKEIERALDLVGARNDIDAAIIARGGGSLEDLAPFNSETVARAIFRNKVPIISAIGHETDYTIADFVSDLRAPTPSAAAELAVPVKGEQMMRCMDLYNRCLRSMIRTMETGRQQNRDLCRRLIHPSKRIQHLQQRIDDLEQRAYRCLGRSLRFKKERFELFKNTLSKIKVNRLITIKKTRLEVLSYKLKQAMAHVLSMSNNRWRRLYGAMDALNPEAVLKRGYSITRSMPSGVIITDACRVQLQQELEILLAHGKLVAKVTGIKNNQH